MNPLNRAMLSFRSLRPQQFLPLTPRLRPKKLPCPLLLRLPVRYPRSSRAARFLHLLPSVHRRFVDCTCRPPRLRQIRLRLPRTLLRVWSLWSLVVLSLLLSPSAPSSSASRSSNACRAARFLTPFPRPHRTLPIPRAHKSQRRILPQLHRLQLRFPLGVGLVARVGVR